MDQPPPRVKICGITRLEDARQAVDLGAWALGMVFWEHSPRACGLEQAQLIAAELRRRVALCGVFVNAPLEQIAGLAGQLDLALVQLHGDEGPQFCIEVARRTGARVIKAVQVRDGGDVRALERYHVDYHLVDTAAQDLRGGSGRTFDWRLLEGRRSDVPLILSGGLEPANVGEAIARVRPFAVDTASGTEAAPGRKDPELLAGFFAAVDLARGAAALS